MRSPSNPLGSPSDPPHSLGLRIWGKSGGQEKPCSHACRSRLAQTAQVIENTGFCCPAWAQQARTAPCWCLAPWTTSTLWSWPRRTRSLSSAPRQPSAQPIPLGMAAPRSGSPPPGAAPNRRCRWPAPRRAKSAEPRATHPSRLRTQAHGAMARTTTPAARTRRSPAGVAAGTLATSSLAARSSCGGGCLTKKDAGAETASRAGGHASSRSGAWR